MPPNHVSSSVPLTQNTAPILEFRCLFTPDLKKKQKKWQDGRLKFHTFNKRVMVYDDRTNYVGDTHYHTYTLEEGDELELERGVLVEVGELIGKQDQDLGEILESVRGAGKSARQASIAPKRGIGRGATPGPSAARYTTPAPAARQMSIMSGGPVRPLSALLGTPQGHHGRALLPTTSPFEDRQNAAWLAAETPEPAAKRRKMDSIPAAQPLWARTSLMQSGSRNNGFVPSSITREVSYPDSIAPKARVKKTFEKAAKPGYAQKLIGAPLDLSSTQKTTAHLARQSSPRKSSPCAESDDEVTITGSRTRADVPAPILPAVKRKPPPILPPKKPIDIVYPESIAPKAKPRKTFEKDSKAGYADKLCGAALDLSSTNMIKVHKRRQSSLKQASSGVDSDDDDVELTDAQERPRVETPIIPPAARRPAPILPQKPTAQKEIVYPDSIPPKSKPKKTFEKKSKAGYAEKLIGASLNLSGRPALAVSIKPSQPTSEEEELMARLADLRAKREASERAAAEDVEAELAAPSPKKARYSDTIPTPTKAPHSPGKENLEDDFVDIDAIIPSPRGTKAAKPRKARAPRKKKQGAAELNERAGDTTLAKAPGVTGKETPASPAMEFNLTKEVPYAMGALEDEAGANDTSPGSAQQSATSAATDMVPQTLDLATARTLRIKAKPKRKMLMMQSLPPKPAAPPAAMALTPAILLGACLPLQGKPAPEPSQATKALADFHDKQKEMLEERKRKFEARKRMPIEIHSSPEPARPADVAMDIPSSPINFDEKEWLNPNARAINDADGSSVPSRQFEASTRVPPTNDIGQQPSATPRSPQTVNRSKPFSIEESADDIEAESEESAITYTEIDNLLHPQRHGSLASRSITAPAGFVDRPYSITPPPQPSLPQSSPAFTQPKPRIKRPLPSFTSTTIKPMSLEAARSSLRRPPVPLFNSTDDEEPQSSLFVRQSPQKADHDPSNAIHMSANTIAEEALASDDEDLSQPVRAAKRVRPAYAERQSSPDWPSDDSGSESGAPSPLPQSNARPVVDSSDTYSDSQAEEGGLYSSPPPHAWGHEFSAAEEERLANGHPVLIKIKSGIRSKEIIRPKSANQVRTGENNPFVGFMRPPLAIVRSRPSSYVITEVAEGDESADGADKDEIMMDLELHAEEERQRKLRLDEARRRTKEFREKKERETRLMEEMNQAEEQRRHEEEEKKNMEEKRLFEEREKQMRQAKDKQEVDQLAMEENKRLEDKRLADRLREEEEERRREEMKRRDEQLKRETEEEERQQRLRLEAEKSAEQERRTKEEAKAKLEEAVQEKLREEQQRIQMEQDDLEAKRKLDDKARFEAMIQMQEKVKALQEELRLSNMKLEEQKERERVERERQEQVELQKLEDVRATAQNEACQRETQAKNNENQSLADLCGKDSRETEQLKLKAADKLRQQRAVEAAATKLASSASSLPRSLPHALVGMRVEEAPMEKEKTIKRAESQKRVDTISSVSSDANTFLEHIEISAGGSFGEGDLVLAAPKVSAFKMPAPRSQTAVQQLQPPRPSMAAPTRSFNGFPTHIHAAMSANHIVTGPHEFAPTFPSTPPAQGYKVPSTLHLSAPSFKPFCKPKSVPIVPKKAAKTMREIRDEQRAERDTREDLKRIPGWEGKGDVLTWETGAWTVEAGDLFDWRPKVGDYDEG